MQRMPSEIEPMLATPDGGRLPEGPGYAYEFKWDGYRAIMRVAPDGTTLLTSRNGIDFTTRYPELRGVLGPALDGHAAVVDGEIVALDEHGRPDFELLQHRRLTSRPVTYLAFDLLHFDDRSLLAESYDDRRALLAGLGPTGTDLAVITPAYRDTDLAEDGLTPHDLLDVAAGMGLEGLVAKVRTSKYHPGRRSQEWLKHPLIRTLEVVIGGWRPGQGRRAGTIGALLLGAHDRDAGDLRYIGDVGTGFTDQALQALQDVLTPLERPTSPFADDVPRDHARGAHWVRPELVGEVVYRQFTPRERRLRHTAWRGLRPDRRPSEVHVPSDQPIG
ncbi:MAG TPA: non-homologous end-joining DNA ligase [Pseudonocardiaceae bacterium]|jgi:bifunctional non-homologous end joining protein LigD|nr:non-homologous end-joining DNA ligase [Pseudonocardiaceae bacterium]